MGSAVIKGNALTRITDKDKLYNIFDVKPLFDDEDEYLEEYGGVEVHVLRNNLTLVTWSISLRHEYFVHEPKYLTFFSKILSKLVCDNNDVFALESFLCTIDMGRMKTTMVTDHSRFGHDWESKIAYHVVDIIREIPLESANSTHSSYKIDNHKIRVCREFNTIISTSEVGNYLIIKEENPNDSKLR